MPAIPSTMQAIHITQPGGPNALQLISIDTPKPTGDQVLIKVYAAGVNRPDVMQRKGLYPAPAGASEIPGLEVAGEIVCLGGQVHNLSVGDKVCALVTGGGYAEYCLANQGLCLTIPQTLSIQQASALPETFFTVWHNVFNLGQLSADQTLLVHGGSSGIGTTAIQLAKIFAARVIITAGSDRKCQACLNLGADFAINYKTCDFVELTRQFTDQQGCDVILDMIGGDYLKRNILCLAEQGRLIQIALQGGRTGELDLARVMLKRLTITGSTLRARSLAFKTNIAKDLESKVMPLIVAGKIAPVIHKTYPLADAALAHELMESSSHIGKIVLSNEH